MSFNMQKLMQQAQDMQKKMQEAQRELESLEVIGESGGGIVKVRMTGKHIVKEVMISDEGFEENDKEMLQDLITAAFNDAVRKIERETGARVKSLTAGMNLPEGLGGFGDLGG